MPRPPNLTRSGAEVHKEAPGRLRGRAPAWALRSPPGAPPRLWRAVDAPLWLKRHASPRTWAQERLALETLSPALQDAPALVDAECPWLLISEAPGQGASDVPAFRAAGAWLRRLHELPCPDGDPLPLAEALRTRARATAARLGGRGAAADRALQRVMDAAPRAALRAWCHRDFEPRNWLMSGDTLRVIDFEHCRPDLAELDLAKLEADLFPARPALKEAFYAGYGPVPDLGLLDAAIALHGLLTLDWGLRHEDAAFVELGARILNR